jgi:hypothetical protein
MSYVLSRNRWEVARPHMERLVARTHESSSIAQLDGSDIVYVARVAVPKIVALAVTIGTRFPAMQTSLGKVLLAAETPVELLTGEYLPLLLQTAGAISADWAACHAAPQVTVTPAALAGFRLPRVASP